MEKQFSWEYITCMGKTLRRGYTTGSCAAAAARAATAMLFGAGDLAQIQIFTPQGIPLNLPVGNIRREPGAVSCSVRKDCGDDPDVTGNIDIFARVSQKEREGVEVEAGEGIGIVTRTGLPVAAGEPAINPVPMSMILREVSEVLPQGQGVKVRISVPQGEEIAKKTFNARLGIKGGLSILGTTGIVEPMSEEAFKKVLELDLKLIAKSKPRFLVLVPGNHGKNLASCRLLIPEQRIIKMSNFVGFMLDKALEYGIKNVLLVGHVGKLLKVAAGIFNTHSRMADARFEVFAAHAALLGAESALINRLYKSTTAEEMVEILDDLGRKDLYDLFSAKISSRAAEYVSEQITIGTVLFSLKRGILGMDQEAKFFLEEFQFDNFCRGDPDEHERGPCRGFKGASPPGAG